jgi:anti-sigma factor RsiW
MNDRWTEKLSEYLDGELSVAERQELEAHLTSCEECAAMLEQLRRVVTRAQDLEDRPPAGDLWSGIAERIGAASSEDAGIADLAERRRRKEALRSRRLTFSLPQLAAASIALMVLSAGTAWLASRAASPAVDVAGVVGTSPDASFTASSYDAAIAELEQIIGESRDRLDTATVRVIEENLLIIDQAIAQARRALGQDPASDYLNEHLAATMRQKLEFLRRAAQLTGAVS